MTEHELISVIMGAYNSEKTIGEAIASILRQTHKKWELIICDDGSSDNTAVAAESFNDPRIRVLKNERNRGLAHALNRCINEAKGRFIARMDADDVCAADRLEKLLKFMKNHPEYGIAGSWMSLFDENGEWGIVKVPSAPTPVDLIKGTPILHASVMMRRECLMKVNGYDESPETERVEDVDLWLRMYEAGIRCGNIQEPLYSMRNDRSALNRRRYRYRINSTRVRLKGCKEMHLGSVCRLHAMKPMLYGLVPARLRDTLRRRTRNRR